MRMAFRDTVDYISEQEYRIVYEGDLEGQNALASVSGLPDYFTSLITLEAAYELREVVEDSTPEWADFMALTDKQWPLQIADKRQAWMRFVQMFKGRAQVPKRTFFDNHSVLPQERRFRS
jgi:hypothetical protein